MRYKIWTPLPGGEGWGEGLGGAEKNDDSQIIHPPLPSPLPPRERGQIAIYRRRHVPALRDRLLPFLLLNLQSIAAWKGDRA